MATYNPTLKQFIVTATANADFQAWVTLWHTAFTNMGWVQLSDAGQINPATVAFPASNNSDAGFEFWRMNDSLQSTYPVVIKIYYGRGSDANNPRMKIDISMSVTNGAGVFTGQVTATAFALSFATPGTRTVSTDPTTAYRWWVSGDTNRFMLVANADVITSPFGTYLSIERTKNSDGTDNGDGVVLHHGPLMTNSGSSFLHIHFPFGASYAPSVLQLNSNVRLGVGGGIQSASTQAAWSSPRASQDTTSTLANGKVYAFAVFPAYPGWKYPLMNVLLYALNDFPLDQSNVTIPFYGSNHTYKPIGASGISALATGAGMSFLMRFE